MLRGFYALERTRTVFCVQCVIAATNIVLAVLLAGHATAGGTAPALVIAYAGVVPVGAVGSYSAAAPRARRPARPRCWSASWSGCCSPPAVGRRGRLGGEYGVQQLGVHARLWATPADGKLQALGAAGADRPGRRRGASWCWPGCCGSREVTEVMSTVTRRLPPRDRDAPVRMGPAPRDARGPTEQTDAAEEGRGRHTDRTRHVLAGRYRLDDLLDESGGARFWRATDRSWPAASPCTCSPTTTRAPTRLLDAARTSATGHRPPPAAGARRRPHEDGVCYVVNEWGPGVSLDLLLAEGPLGAAPRRLGGRGGRRGDRHRPPQRRRPRPAAPRERADHRGRLGQADRLRRRRGAAHRAGRGQRRVTGGEPMSAHESDVVDLAGLLYAALAGRWPGSVGLDVPRRAHRARPGAAAAPGPGRRAPAAGRDLRAGAQPGRAPARAADRDRARDLRGAQRLHRRPGAAAPPGSVDDEATAAARPRRPARRAGDAGPATGPGRTTRTPATGTPATWPRPTPSRPPPRPPATSRTGPAASEPPGPTRRPPRPGVPMFFDEGSGVGWLPDARPVAARRARTPGRPAARRPHRARDRPPPDRPVVPPPAPARAARAAAVRRRPRRGGRAARRAAASRAGRPAAPPAPAPAPVRHRRPASTGAGNGPLPTAWGPTRTRRRRARRPPRRALPGRSWLRLAVAIAWRSPSLLLAIVVAFNLGRGPGTGSDATAARGSSTSPSAPATASARLAITGVAGLRPAGRPAGGEPRPGPARGRRQARHRVADADLPRQLRARRAQDRRRAARSTSAAATRSARSTAHLLGSPTSRADPRRPDATAAPTSTDGLDDGRRRATAPAPQPTLDPGQAGHHAVRSWSG